MDERELQYVRAAALLYQTFEGCSAARIFTRGVASFKVVVSLFSKK